MFLKLLLEVFWQMSSHRRLTFSWLDSKSAVSKLAHVALAVTLGQWFVPSKHTPQCTIAKACCLSWQSPRYSSLQFQAYPTRHCHDHLRLEWLLSLREQPCGADHVCKLFSQASAMFGTLKRAESLHEYVRFVHMSFVVTHFACVCPYQQNF